MTRQKFVQFSSKVVTYRCMQYNMYAHLQKAETKQRGHALSKEQK